MVEGCGGVVAGKERGEMDPHGSVGRRGGQDGFEGGPDGGIESHAAIVPIKFGRRGENRAHRRETLLASESAWVGDAVGHTDGAMEHLSRVALEAGLDHIRRSPRDEGTVELIACRPGTSRRLYLLRKK